MKRTVCVSIFIILLTFVVANAGMAATLTSITIDPEDASGATTNAPGAWSTNTGLGPPGNHLVVGTFELTSIGMSSDEIWLYDYDPDGPDWAAGIVYGGGILDHLVVPNRLAYMNNYANSNAVPVPGAVWLLGSGLAGLVALRRRMKN